MTPYPASAEDILQARARALAQTPPAVEAEAGIDIVAFELAGDACGVEIRFLREVHPVAELFPLPGVPDFVAGVVNLHGEVLSVVDLRRYFGLPSTGRGSQAVVIADGSMEFGILAEVVLGVRSVPPQAIVPPTAAMGGSAREYLIGMAEGLFLLDAAKLLADPGLVVDQQD